MKSKAGLLSLIPCALLFTLTACGGSSEPAAPDSSATTAASAPAARSMSEAEAKALLLKAAENSGKLTSFHASATATKEGTSKIESDLTVGATHSTVTRPDGTVWRHIATTEGNVMSGDGGETWTADEDKVGAFTESIVTIGYKMMPKMVADISKGLSLAGIRKETVDGVEATRISLKAAEHSTELWVADHATLGPYLKRIQTPIALPDGDLNVDVTYSRLNEQVEIALPE